LRGRVGSFFGDRMAGTSYEAIWAHLPRSLDFSGAAGFAAPSRVFTWVLRIVCCLALGITGYLAFTALRLEEVAGCSGAYWDCSHVLHSRWSKVWAVPVSVPAFALYAVLLAALTVCRRPGLKSRLLFAWGTITVGAIAAGIVAFWFAGLQIFSVRHLCPYCMAAHACGLTLFLAILWKRPLGARTTAKLSAVSLLGVSALIAAQVFSTPPPTYKIERYPTPAVNNAPAPTATNPTHGPKTREKSRPAEVFEAPPDSSDAPSEK
jgi:uncharacterized membrane protein